MQSDISRVDVVIGGFLEILSTTWTTLDRLSASHDWDGDSYWFEDVINNTWLGVVGRTLCPNGKFFPLFCPLNNLKKEDVFLTYDRCVVARINRCHPALGSRCDREYFVYSFVIHLKDGDSTKVNAMVYDREKGSLLEVPVGELSFNLRACGLAWNCPP